MKISRLVKFIVLALLAFSNCKIGDDSPMRNFYTFSVDINLDPVKNEYLNGDLLWMSTDLPGKQFTDENSGEAVRVGNGKFTFRVDVFDPFVQPDNSVKFSLANQAGVTTEVGDFKESGSVIVSFGCPANSYNMQVGIQFLKPGGYLMYLNRDEPFPQVVFTEEDDCSLIPVNQIPPDNANIGTVIYNFNVSDTNKDEFETYAAGFPNANVDIDSIRTALDDGKALFVLVK